MDFVVLGVIFYIMSDKINYLKSLHDIRWKDKRKEILARDKYTCQRCRKEQCYLEVHHKKYESGKMAWEYKNEDLTSLCQDCHHDISLHIKNINYTVNSIMMDYEKSKSFVFLMEQICMLDTQNIAELGDVAYNLLKKQPSFRPKKMNMFITDEFNDEDRFNE